jgi:cystathionine beta-lyase/cystathionine gamma-synthase
VEATDKFLKAVRLAIIAISLGGVDTLATRPAITTHAGLSPEERRRAGIADGLIRLSIGIEATDDLIEDFDQALGTWA